MMKLVRILCLTLSLCATIEDARRSRAMTRKGKYMRRRSIESMLMQTFSQNFAMYLGGQLLRQSPSRMRKSLVHLVQMAGLAGSHCSQP